MDVSCNLTGIHNGKNSCEYKEGEWPASALKKQANIYNNFLKICLEEPNCFSFESWGFTDEYSSKPKGQSPLPFDGDLKKKPAFYSMLKTLQEFPRDHPSVLAKLSSQLFETTTINFLQ